MRTVASWDRTASHEIEATRWSNRTGRGRHRLNLRDAAFRYIFVLPLLMALVVGIVLYKLFDLQHIAAEPLWVGYSTLVATYLLSRFVLAMQYTPPTISDPQPEFLPKVTIVIPSMNEEVAIERTIRAAVASDYPADLLEIIAIDDGSTDRTGDIMLEMEREFANVRAIIFPENLGKREGMATGVVEGHGDVIVFIDSDSRVARNGIRRIAQYFAYPEVGAVSGIVDVDNKKKNILTKMQTVRYFVAFDVVKSAEARFGAVPVAPAPSRHTDERLSSRCSPSGCLRASWEQRALTVMIAPSRTM